VCLVVEAGTDVVVLVGDKAGVAGGSVMVVRHLRGLFLGIIL
jgi:hypothetical protein